jgi:hypothetical protein
MADNLPPSSADVTESESLNLPELSGPHSPVMGLLYRFLLLPHYYIQFVRTHLLICLSAISEIKELEVQITLNLNTNYSTLYFHFSTDFKQQNNLAWL